MSERRSMRSRKGTWSSELRLDRWRHASARPERTGDLLGSLRGVLIDFVPALAVPVVPAQRTRPDVAARLRRPR